MCAAGLGCVSEDPARLTHLQAVEGARGACEHRVGGRCAHTPERCAGMEGHGLGWGSGLTLGPAPSSSTALSCSVHNAWAGRAEQGVTQTPSAPILSCARRWPVSVGTCRDPTPAVSIILTVALQSPTRASEVKKKTPFTCTWKLQLLNAILKGHKPFAFFHSV